MDWQERLLTAFFCAWQRMPSKEDFFLPHCKHQWATRLYEPRGICWSRLEG